MQNFKQDDLSRTLTEALHIAHDATQSEAFSLRGLLEDDPKCVGHVRMVIEQRMNEAFEAVQVIRDTLKRRGHPEVLKRLREHERWLREP